MRVPWEVVGRFREKEGLRGRLGFAHYVAGYGGGGGEGYGEEMWPLG